MGQDCLHEVIKAKGQKCCPTLIHLLSKEDIDELTLFDYEEQDLMNSRAETKMERKKEIVRLRIKRILQSYDLPDLSKVEVIQSLIQTSQMHKNSNCTTIAMSNTNNQSTTITQHQKKGNETIQTNQQVANKLDFITSQHSNLKQHHTKPTQQVKRQTFQYRGSNDSLFQLDTNYMEYSQHNQKARTSSEERSWESFLAHGCNKQNFLNSRRMFNDPPPRASEPSINSIPFGGCLDPTLQKIRIESKITELLQRQSASQNSEELMKERQRVQFRHTVKDQYEPKININIVNPNRHTTTERQIQANFEKPQRNRIPFRSNSNNPFYVR